MLEAETSRSFDKTLAVKKKARGFRLNSSRRQRAVRRCKGCFDCAETFASRTSRLRSGGKRPMAGTESRAVAISSELFWVPCGE
jgi:hypothetical protein